MSLRLIAALSCTIALFCGVCVPARADNELAAARSTFYILAPGGDNSIGPLIHALTDRLQALFDHAQGPGSVWVIPRTSWEPGDLESQCENDPNKDNATGPKVLGGFILEGTNTYSSTDPFVIWSHGWAKVSSNAELVECKPPKGFTKPTITWIANDLHGYGSRNGFPFETVAAGILFFSLKNSDAKYVALGTAVGGASGASTIPPVNDAGTTRDAVLRVANDLLQKFNSACATASDLSFMCSKLGLPATTFPTPPPE